MVFQSQVWDVLQQVKYGEIVSYLDIVKVIGNLKVVCVVGMVNGCNFIVIVVFCYCIIGSNKILMGYVGGLLCKQYLFNLEGV